MENIVTLVSTALGSTLVSSFVAYYTTKKKYLTEIELLKTDNFTKVVDKYQNIVDDLQGRYELSETRYNDLITRYNELMDTNLKLQSEIQTLKIQIRKIQKNENA